MVRSLRTLLVLAALFALSACGLTQAQRESIADFGKATQGLGKTVSESLVASRDDIRDISYGVVASSPAATDAERRLVARFLDEPDGVFRNKEVLPVRVKAAEMLATYGELLAGLASDTRKAEIEAAVGNLKTSISGLPSEYVSISPQDLDAIGEAVRAIGMLLVDYKKAQAIRTIVPKAAPQIEKLAALLARDFRPAPQGAQTTIADELRLRSDGGYDAATRSLRDVQKLNLTDRRVAIDALRRAQLARTRVQDHFPQMADAIDKVRAAHAKIVEGLERGSIDQTAIRAFSDAVTAVVKASLELAK